ncbi:MAG TPA: hypothetical protein VE400_01205, partial [Mycobacterium sp.]|nr:hypothetical protein [Mycobacterium sp.]
TGEHCFGDEMFELHCASPRTVDVERDCVVNSNLSKSNVKSDQGMRSSGLPPGRSGDVGGRRLNSRRLPEVFPSSNYPGT